MLELLIWHDTPWLKSNMRIRSSHGLYLRVSTLDQHPETQLYYLRQMADQRGWQVVEEYTDRVSGAKARRPGLDRLMSDARHGRFDVVLVWASDRLARSVKHFLEVLDELSRLNVEFISFRENLDTGGPLGARSSSSSRPSQSWNAI
jgi:DNA invertase Pin-like site-specific DNA recombinase